MSAYYYTVSRQNSNVLHTSSWDLPRTEYKRKCTFWLHCKCVEQTARKEIVSETVPATTRKSIFFS